MRLSNTESIVSLAFCLNISTDFQNWELFKPIFIFGGVI